MARPLLLPVVLCALGACSSTKGTPSADGGAAHAPPPYPAERAFETGALLGADCDPLVPTACGYPLPSSVYLADDPSTPTKKRVRFGATTLPEIEPGKRTDPAAWSDFDGFSLTTAPAVHLPGATTAGLPAHEDIGASLAPSSPTILMRADTGERVPHFAEIDVSLAGDADGVLTIRPAVPLREATRYVVAIRNVKDKAGAPLAPSPAFLALRDKGQHESPSIERRRELYEDMFLRLERVGVARADLQIAWDFTTSSREYVTRGLLHMRDTALAAVGADGPEYEITEIRTDPGPDLPPQIAKQIRGTMTVPLFLDRPGVGARLVLGTDGRPAQNGTAKYPFVVNVPKKALTSPEPLALLQNGHGLLDTRLAGTEGWYSFLNHLAEDYGFVTFSVDMIGLSEEDQGTLFVALGGDMSGLRAVLDRQHQGMLNHLLAMRMMKGRFARDPAVQVNGRPAYDPQQTYYRGDSQGGIVGTTYMALSTDVTRGVLGVPGMSYNLMLNRSSNFPLFFQQLESRYKTSRNVQLLLHLIQMPWDRVEGSGWAGVLREQADKRVMLHVAVDDQQVTPLAAHLLARGVGARLLTPAPRKLFGIEESARVEGSSIVEWSFTGAVPPSPGLPRTNTPPADTDKDIQPAGGFTGTLPTTHPWRDPHRRLRNLPLSWRQTSVFLRTGITEHVCEGPCDPD